MAVILKLADKVAELLKEFGAKVSYAPSFDVRFMTERNVVVLPFGIGKKIVSRIALAHEYVLNVAVIDKCHDDADIVELVNLTDTIGSALFKCRMDSATCVAVEWDPLYSVEELRAKKVFISVIKATFKDVSA